MPAPIATPPRAKDIAPPEMVAALPAISTELPPDSDLVLVETRHANVPAIGDEGSAAPRPRRVRPPRAQLVEEPLELVETHKVDMQRAE